MCQLDFFFSSRRRHTRCSRDWSSDVCSSDLQQGIAVCPGSRSATTVETPGRESTSVRSRPWPTMRFHWRWTARTTFMRSEERRVGEEGRFRWSPDHLKKKKKNKDMQQRTRLQ